jgi:hypothetical protein
MRRRWPVGVRLGVTILAIAVVVLSAVVLLTDPDPGGMITRPGRLGRWLSSWAAPTKPPGPARPAPSQRPVALFSDDWFDDSGFSLTTAFTEPVSDPTSLEQLRAVLAGRAERGIAQLQATLDRLEPTAPDALAHTARLNLIIGSLNMFEGQFDEAARRFELSLKAFPEAPELIQANMQAMIGIAAMRRGETENCVACRNEASCLFPLAPEAFHRRTAGSQEAIRRFTAYLEKRPEDIGVRWLLNIAYMTLGEYPARVPPKYLIPLEPFLSKVDIGRFVNIASRVGLDVRGPKMAGACIVDDFDNDGWLDVFTSTSDPASGPSFFINQGDGTFADRTESAGLADQVAALNAKQADFDNDGWLDILLMRGAWELPRRPSLLRNNGDGTFTDVTIKSGVAAPIATQGGAWGDYDNDGWLDLYLPGEFDDKRPNPDNRGKLYHSNRDGTFTDVADQAGVRNERFGKGSDWGDYDNDGDLDLYVSNLGQANRLYRNNGDGTFTDVAREMGVTEPLSSFACWWWDYDNDGLLDLFVCPYKAHLSEVIRSHLGLRTTGERPRLYHNEGSFRDVSHETGLDRVLLPMGSNFGDLDNDGFLDIYLGTGRPPYMYLEPNVMFKNMSGKRFEDVTTSTGTGHLQKGHGVAFADWDRDGDVDVFLESGGATPGDMAGMLLFQNPGHGQHWLNVKLIGVTTNRSALGARIDVEMYDERGRDHRATPLFRRHRVVTSGSSFGGNPLATTIGLGSAQGRILIRVKWPASKTTQVFQDVKVDRAIEITEGQSTYRTLDWGRSPRASTGGTATMRRATTTTSCCRTPGAATTPSTTGSTTPAPPQ